MSYTRTTVTTGRRAVAALLLTVLGACESATTFASAEGGAVLASTATETDIHAATLDYMFASHGVTDRDAFCVSTGYPEANDDPSADLLARFAGHQPPVVAYSSCTIAVGGDTYNATGGPAQWFFLGTPEVASNGRRATIQTGWHINGRLVEWYSCSLRLSGAAWSVSSCTLTAVG